ncbi:MAG: hypothetical protein ACUVQV_08090 [Dissulfurimicrobium sp.]|uniref:hypothetical protein n=1 Tax=Dissulfurimicrobium sp. TaxID=2022436 RepID=UPI00404A8BAF
MIKETCPKTALAIIVTFFLAAFLMLIPQASNAAQAADSTPVLQPGHQVVAYFFHGTYQ